MIKICFICHGNICRSPMAEYVMKNKIKNLNIDNKFLVVSRATSYEEQGCDIYPKTKEILNKYNIPYSSHKATRLEQTDYEKYDYFICMDENNIKNTLKILKSDPENKVFKLLKRDVEDPWYTNNFMQTYKDIDEGTNKLIDMLKFDIEG